MGVIFSKLSGQTDSLYKAVEGVVTEVITDEETGITEDDKLLSQMFKIKKSKQFGERVGGMTEFSNFTIVGEGGVADKDELEEGYGKLVVHEAFSKDFVITHEMIADAKAIKNFDDAKDVAANFVKAYKRSKVEFATNYLVAEGASFSYGGKTLDRTVGDGKGIFATDHPSKKGYSSQSNVFTNDLGTDSQMLMRLANIGRQFKNDSGHVQSYLFDTIIIPGNTWEMEDTIRKIIISTNIVGSANNDANTQKNKWNLIVNPYWEVASGQNPFILMSSKACQERGGLRFYNREDLDVRNEIDLSTRNMKWNGYCRFSCLCVDWRCVILGGAQNGTTLA